MAKSAAAVLEAEIVEDYSANTSFSRPESRTYRVERNHQGVWHHESMTDAEGNVLFDQAVEVHYAVGSGSRGRSYLIDRGGLMKVSPITWYTQEARWDLSPGYQPRTHQRFNRRAIDGCLACHVGRLAFERDKPSRFGDPPILEATIGCERCHGPGGEHVARHQTGAGEDFGPDPIVNPVHLSPEAREDVCNQCHLTGERLLRYGRTEYDFRPGQRLEETWTVFPKNDDPARGDGMRAVGQVDQMRESACFKGSAGRMGCLSCHDPHSIPAAADRGEHYNSRCAACHSGRGCSFPEVERLAEPAVGSCIACHMRPIAASNVPHTSQTDHRISRRPGTDAKRVAGPELFDNAELRLPQVDLDRARGLLAMRKPRLGDVRLAARLEAMLLPALKLHPDDIDVLRDLGTLSMLQNRPAEVRERWRLALRIRPEDESILLLLARFESERGNTADAIEYLLRYRAIDPWDADLSGSLAHLYWKQGSRTEAIDAALEGLQLDPRLIPLRKWLANSLGQLGRAAEADEQNEVIRKMDGR
jgi:hypothetical protein